MIIIAQKGLNDDAGAGVCFPAFIFLVCDVPYCIVKQEYMFIFDGIAVLSVY